MDKIYEDALKKVAKKEIEGMSGEIDEAMDEMSDFLYEEIATLLIKMKMIKNESPEVAEQMLVSTLAVILMKCVDNIDEAITLIDEMKKYIIDVDKKISE